MGNKANVSTEALTELKAALYDAVVYGRMASAAGILPKAFIEDAIVAQRRVDVELHRRANAAERAAR